MGHFLAAAVSIPYGVMTFLFVPFPAIVSQWSILSVLLSIPLLLHSSTFYGFWRNYGSKTSAGAFACGLIAAPVVLVSGVIAAGSCGPPYFCYRAIPAPALLSFIVSLVLTGVMSITEGVAFLTIRRSIQMPEEARAAGMVCLVAGAFLVSVLLGLLVGFFVLSAALTLGGLVSRRAPVLSVPAPQAAPPRLA